MKLNLGCGNDIKPDYINVDAIKHNGVNQVHNLNKFPYPFKGNSCEIILAYNIIEHLDNPTKVMKELHRLLSFEGLLKIKVPHFSSCFLWADPTHKRGFSINTFDFWTNKFLTKDNWLADIKFEVVDKKIIWGANKLRKVDLITPIINLFPIIYERFLSYIIPSEEVWVTLRKQ